MELRVINTRSESFGGHTNFGVFIGFVDSKKNIQLNSRGLNILFVPNQSLASVLDRENKQKMVYSFLFLLLQNIW